MDRDAALDVEAGDGAGEASPADAGPTCRDLLSCFDKCMLADMACAQSCSSGAAGPVQQAFDMVVSCVRKQCATRCLSANADCTYCRANVVEGPMSAAGACMLSIDPACDKCSSPYNACVKP